jgi:hypothetical protein
MIIYYQKKGLMTIFVHHTPVWTLLCNMIFIQCIWFLYYWLINCRVQNKIQQICISLWLRKEKDIHSTQIKLSFYRKKEKKPQKLMIQMYILLFPEHGLAILKQA